MSKPVPLLLTKPIARVLREDFHGCPFPSVTIAMEEAAHTIDALTDAIDGLLEVADIREDDSPLLGHVQAVLKRARGEV